MTQSLKTAPGWALWAVNIGLIVIMAGTLLPLLHVWLGSVRWIYGAGALVHLAGRIAAFRATSRLPLRLKRLHHIEMWAALFFVVATVFMFVTVSTDWIAFTLAGGALLAYTSIMIPRVAAKEK